MNIYESIAGIMGELGAISKNKKNHQQGFMYRGIDDVMNTLNPLLTKYQVFIVPEVLEHIREERQSNKGNTLLYSICKIKYTFYAADGTNISAVVVGEGMDSGDKATNKAMAIAMKYACFQTFCIATEEMQDPDAEAHEVKPRKEEKPKQNGDTPSEVQLKKIYALSKQKNLTAEDMQTIMLERYSKDNSKSLTKKEVSDLITFLEGDK
jgi:hypothetical protein